MYKVSRNWDKFQNIHKLIVTESEELEIRGNRMSLALIQDYSSAEEVEEEDYQQQYEFQNSSDDQDDAVPPSSSSNRYHPVLNVPKPSNSSGLPSAFDVFSQVNLLLLSPVSHCVSI